MPRPQAEFVHQQFKIHTTADGTQGNKTACHFHLIPANCKGQAACKHCQYILLDINTTCKRKYLVEECSNFLDHTQSKRIDNYTTRDAVIFKVGQ